MFEMSAMISRALSVLLFSFVVAGKAPGDISSCRKSIYLPYAEKFSAKFTPTIKGQIKGKDYTIPVDTGGTGLLIGASKLSTIPKSEGTFGVEYLSSSSNLYTGRFVNISITFPGKNNNTAHAKVPALIVDSAVVCPSYNVTKGDGKCPDPTPETKNIDDILYMGVGFGRNTQGSGLPYAIPSHNPFLNVRSINGKKVGKKNYCNGYTVSTKGIYLGLTPRNTDQYNWVKLDRGSTPDPRDWAMVRTSFKVDDRGSFSGAALIDTGIPQMYVQAYPAGSIPNVTVKDTFHGPSKEGRDITLVKEGTHLDFGFPALGADGGVVGYDFRVGDKKFKSQPAWVQPVTLGSGPHVNTGRKFLYGFSVAFDAVGGRFGFKCLRC